MISIICHIAIFISLVTVPLSLLAVWLSHRQTDSLSWVMFAFSMACLFVGVDHLLLAISPWWHESKISCAVEVAAALAAVVAAIVSPVAVRLFSVVPQSKQVRTLNTFAARRICELEDSLRADDSGPMPSQSHPPRISKTAV